MGRHDEVQERALRATLKANDVYVSTSKVHELRQPNDINDKDQRKGDLTIEGLFHEGKTILDVGITHPTIDTYMGYASVPMSCIGILYWGWVLPRPGPNAVVHVGCL